MAIPSGVLLPGVAENPTFPILSTLVYTTGLGYRPTSDIFKAKVFRVRVYCRTCSELFIVILYMYTEIVLECWTTTQDVHGLGGRDIYHVIKINETLKSCKTACFVMRYCVGIDWEDSKASGTNCWLLNSTATIPTTVKGVITHYEINRICSS